MRLAVTSGGTAGHIYPALAVAQELVRRGHEVVFAGTPVGPEARLAPEAGLPYRAFAAAGFNRSRPWTLLSSSIRLGLSTRAAKSWLADFAPCAVAGFGGYVSVPVGRAATQLGIPLLLHEQNSAAGWANRYLAKQAQAVALTYAAAEEALSANPSAEVRVTGNPVRKALLEASAHEVRSRARSAFRKELGIANDDRVLLVFGGSQGARHINQAMTAMREELMAVSGLHVLHITGKNELDSVRSQLSGFEAAQGRWHLLGYCDRMPEAYSASDVAVARAGAGSLAELAAMSLPALLVPYPFATDDHQRANASAMVEAGAAVMVADADLDTPLFAETLMSLLCDVQGQLRMQRATRKQAQGDAAAAVADMLLAIARD